MADSADKTDELYPIAVLIDELKVTGAIFVCRGVSLIDLSTMMFFCDLMLSTVCQLSRSHWELSAPEMN